MDEATPTRDRWLKSIKKHLSFQSIHYVYILSFTFLGAVLIVIPGNMSFIDALFFSSGSATQSGLNTIDLNIINTFQQIVTYILPLITAPVFMHTMVVVFRIRAFEQRLKDVVLDARRNAVSRVLSRSRSMRQGQSVDVERRDAIDTAPVEKRDIHILSATKSDRKAIKTSDGDDHKSLSEHIKFENDIYAQNNNNDDDDKKNDGDNSSHSLRIKESPPIPDPESSRSRSLSKRLSLDRTRTLSRARTRSPEPTYLSYVPEVGKNSLFLDLTAEQKNELGGIEYRALKSLLVILILYYVVIHLLGFLMLVPWILKSQRYGTVLTHFGINKVWWAAYTSATTFGDVGFTLTPDSMVSFQEATFVLLLCSIFIIAGNTGFPLFLRLFIWIAFKLCPDSRITLKDELHFLLDHPRRCFTLLFPSGPTWWLFGILVFLNAADVILFLVLDLKTPVIQSIPVGYRILNAFFQAVNTRTAGTASVPIGELHPGIQVSYMVMMYISVMPIAISIRRTNVYEDISLGVWSDPNEPSPNRNMSQAQYIKAHIRRQLEFDLWYVFAGLFLISIVEGTRIANPQDPAFNVFSILFEVVSAYGTVGLSLGYPGLNTSLSGAFSTFSKLVIVAMEVRGRHRGLPYDLDRAVLLPHVDVVGLGAGRASKGKGKHVDDDRVPVC